MLDAWTDISDTQIVQYIHNELDNTFFSARITTGEYVACYIALLFQKVILPHN